jgi:hypothetical protein
MRISKMRLKKLRLKNAFFKCINVKVGKKRNLTKKRLTKIFIFNPQKCKNKYTQHLFQKKRAKSIPKHF